jgi:hypothetical protein
VADGWFDGASALDHRLDATRDSAPMSCLLYLPILGKACFDHVDAKETGLPDLFVYPFNGVRECCSVK